MLLYYPMWSGSENKCSNDNGMLDYMRSNHAWLYDDVESCCVRYFSWDYNECVTISGGTSTASYSNNWYVDHYDELCKQDCPEENGGMCTGLAENWNELFESTTACCENKLSWVR